MKCSWKRVFIAILVIFMTINVISYAGGVVRPMSTIEDREFFLNDYLKPKYKHNPPTDYVSLEVGQYHEGIVGTEGGKNSKQTLYTVKVPEDGILEIRMKPRGNYMNLFHINYGFGTVGMVSDDSGEKQRGYIHAGNGSLGSSPVIFKGEEGCFYSAVMTAGTYYFTVHGEAYTKEDNFATNYLTYFPYTVSVNLITYPDAKDFPNNNKDNPYVLNESQKFLATMGMTPVWYPSLSRYLLQESNYFKIPAGSKREIKLTLRNVDHEPLTYYHWEKKGIRLESGRAESGMIHYEVLDKENKKNSPKIRILDPYGKDHWTGKWSYLTAGEVKDYEFVAEEGVEYLFRLEGDAPQFYELTFWEGDPELSGNDVVGDNSGNGNSENQGNQEYQNNQGDQNSQGNQGNTSGAFNSNTSSSAENKISGYDFIQGNQTYGEIESYGNGLKLVGGAWTNGRVKDNKRDGNNVLTSEKFNLMNKRLDLSFTPYSEKYAAFNAGAECYSGKYCSTHHSWAGSPVVASGQVVYKTFLFDANQGIKEVIATGNYYDKSGAKILYENTTAMDEKIKNNFAKPQSVRFFFVDNYGGTDAYILANEFIISELNGNPSDQQDSSNQPNTGNTEDSNTGNSESQNNLDGDNSAKLSTASGWAKDEIKKAIDEGFYTKKMMEQDFKSYSTREEFAELVIVMFEKLGGKSNTGNNPFTDTSNPSVVKAYNAGIIKGVSADKFAPDKYLTREQLCVLIMRALNASGKSYEFKSQFQKNYDDIAEISPWAKDSVEILNGYKIINGNGAKLSPKGKVTREVAVLMLYRAYETFK